MIFNKILVCSFGLALFNTNINAMENNNKTNVNVMENNNKLSISKQENFKINSHNITTQSRLNKLEKKIDEILDMQKILSARINADNNILQDNMKKLSRDNVVSNSLLGSFNTMSSNIDTNTKQINEIKKLIMSMSNNLDIYTNMNIYMLLTLFKEVNNQQTALEENNNMIRYLINSNNHAFGLSGIFQQQVNCDDNSSQDSNTQY